MSGRSNGAGKASSRRIRPAPDTVQKARFIIRTRSQAARAPAREPLRDALTNSPSKGQPRADRAVMGDTAAPLLHNRKRALSQSDDEDDVAVKRLKQAQSPTINNAMTSSEQKPPIPHATIMHTVQRASTPRVPGAPAAPNRGNFLYPTKPALSTFPSPTTVSSEPMFDLFNPPSSPRRPTSPSKPFQYQLGPPTLSERHPSGGSKPKHAAATLDFGIPLPALQLFAKSTISDNGRTPAPTTSTTHRVQLPGHTSDDEAMEELESPSKKAKNSTNAPRSKISMIPRPVPTARNFKFKGPTLKPLAAPPVRQTTLKEMFRNGGRTASSRPTSFVAPGPSVVPAKRPVASPEPPAPDGPPRPSSSLGFNDGSRRSSLTASAQTSLSNLSMALEKLSIPRVRSSFGAGGSSNQPKVGGNGRPLVNAGSSTQARPLTRASTISGGSSLGSTNRRVQVNRPVASIGLGRPSVINRNRTNMPPPPPPPPRDPEPASETNSITSLPGRLLSTSSSEAITPSTSETSNSGDERSLPDDRNRRASLASRSLAMTNASGEAATGFPEVSGSSGKKSGKKGGLSVLKDCVIYVDIKTDDGSDASELFVSMLKGLGARIISRLTPNVTHIVFKSGSPTTLSKHKIYGDPKPFLVGIGWIVECVEKRARVDEASFLVDEPDPVVFDKKRKSMQPKMMVPVMPSFGTAMSAPSSDSPSEGPYPSNHEDSDVTMVASSSPTPPAESSIPPLERARRKSQLFAPKVSSPLKRGFKPMDEDLEETLEYTILS